MNLSSDLTTIFPITFSLLGSEQAADLQSRFLQEWGLLNLHFFPMVLREQRFPLAAIEAADFEFQLYFLSSQNFSMKPSLSANLIVHPSCQFVQISASAEALGRPAGLYVLWKNAVTVNEKRLDKAEAALLDRLQEDLPVYRQSLDRAELGIFKNLLNLGVIAESLPKNQPFDESAN
ncbi:MAG: hypothetical protein ACXWC9_10395 [Pseudobdellovibrionaceae bacterium]